VVVVQRRVDLVSPAGIPGRLGPKIADRTGLVRPVEVPNRENVVELRADRGDYLDRARSFIDLKPAVIRRRGYRLSSQWLPVYQS
jgi:hypothetical protein